VELRSSKRWAFPVERWSRPPKERHWEDPDLAES
jgi:hypothetical protein